MSRKIYAATAVAHAPIFDRRIKVLSKHLAELIPRDASVLDVGAGDGRLAARLLERRPDLKIRGVDVLVRGTSLVPIQEFDGQTLPFGDRSIDVVMMVDVLHHAALQMALLRETARVAARAVIIKDHLLQGVLAHPTLRFMDWVGNARHGVALPYSYWTPTEWSEAFRTAGLTPVVEREKLRLYPWPASLLFDRGLHFIRVLEPRR